MYKLQEQENVTSFGDIFFSVHWYTGSFFYHTRTCEKDVSWENDFVGTVFQSYVIIIHCQISLKGNMQLPQPVLANEGILSPPLPEYPCKKDCNTNRKHPLRRIKSLIFLNHVKWQRANQRCKSIEEKYLSHMRMLQWNLCHI